MAASAILLEQNKRLAYDGTNWKNNQLISRKQQLVEEIILILNLIDCI